MHEKYRRPNEDPCPKEKGENGKTMKGREQESVLSYISIFPFSLLPLDTGGVDSISLHLAEKRFLITDFAFRSFTILMRNGYNGLCT
jgi:hypothetical protein